MKTYLFSSKRLSIYGVFGFLAMVLTSCGSYQNSSYYDNDGVYGNSQSNRAAKNSNSQSDKYQQYFSDLNKQSDAFVDIESYTSVANDTVQKSQNNSSWGDNPQSVTINVYDNSWGYGYWNNYWYGNYWGWNNFYGPNWGWGWNSWYGPSWSIGWGWNNWGWYNGYYPYYGGGYGHWHGNNNYYYNGGRRGTYATAYSGSRFGRSGYNNVNSGRRGNTYTTTAPSRNSNFNYNSRSNTRGNTNYTPTRSNSNTYSTQPTRTTTQPTRSEPARNYSAPTRSYTPSSSGGGGRSGGGSYGGGGGGGRSGGGGGRR